MRNNRAGACPTTSNSASLLFLTHNSNSLSHSQQQQKYGDSIQLPLLHRDDPSSRPRGWEEGNLSAVSDQIGCARSEGGGSGGRFSTDFIGTSSSIRRTSAIRSADAASRRLSPAGRIRSTVGCSAATGKVAVRTDATNAAAGLRADAGDVAAAV